jgi:AcrR family transcriptional regulator
MATRAETQAATRASLLDAADEVFAERGYFGASVNEIAARAGFTVGAVYSNFSTKADLFYALFEERIAEQLADYTAITAEAETTAGRARGPADRWMTFLRDRPSYFPLFLEFAAAATRDATLARGLGERLEMLHETFGQMVAAGAAAEGIDLSAETSRQLGVVVTALANGLALAKVADPAGIEDELFGNFLAFFFERVAQGATS